MVRWGGQGDPPVDLSRDLLGPGLSASSIGWHAPRTTLASVTSRAGVDAIDGRWMGVWREWAWLPPVALEGLLGFSHLPKMIVAITCMMVKDDVQYENLKRCLGFLQ